MSRRRIDLAHCPAVPWANNRGVTRELLREEASDGSLLLRLSVAEIVEPGPFSRLPGLDRILVPIAGPGFELAVDGGRVVLGPLDPVTFAGEAEVAVTAIAAASRDFNVMVARTKLRAHVVVQRGRFRVPDDGVSFIYVVDGTFSCDGETATLEPGQLLDLGIGSPTGPVCTGEGSALLITILPS